MWNSDASAASDATNRPQNLASLASLCGTDGVWGATVDSVQIFQQMT